MALDRYLGELDDTKVAFAVRQGRPKTLEEAVAATLEMESYLSHGQKKEAGVSVVHEQMDGGQEVDTDACQVCTLLREYLLSFSICLKLHAMNGTSNLRIITRE